MALVEGDLDSPSPPHRGGAGPEVAGFIKQVGALPRAVTRASPRFVDRIVAHLAGSVVADVSPGEDTGSSVSDDYEPHASSYIGKVKWVQIDINETAEDNDHLITPEERLRIVRLWGRSTPRSRDGARQASRAPPLSRAHHPRSNEHPRRDGPGLSRPSSMKTV
jgi:hypothetical protein